MSTDFPDRSGQVLPRLGDERRGLRCVASAMPDAGARCCLPRCFPWRARIAAVPVAGGDNRCPAPMPSRSSRAGSAVAHAWRHLKTRARRWPGWKVPGIARGRVRGVSGRLPAGTWALPDPPRRERIRANAWEPARHRPRRIGGNTDTRRISRRREQYVGVVTGVGHPVLAWPGQALRQHDDAIAGVRAAGPCSPSRQFSLEYHAVRRHSWVPPRRTSATMAFPRHPLSPR